MRGIPHIPYIRSIKLLKKFDVPDIMGIQELNLIDIDDTDLIRIPGYTLIWDNLIQSHGNSRAGLLINDSLKYQRIDDLTNQLDACIAITVHLTKKQG